MRKRVLFLLTLLLAASLFAGASAFENREELRAAYEALGAFEDDSLYESEPSAAAPYDAGAVSEAALEDTLSYLNWIRAVAGLAPVERNPLYDLRCQHGATLLAALDYADHNAPRPEDMDEDFYQSAHEGTSSSNIAKLNWMRPTILRDGIAYFVRDDGDGNLSVLGHRQWALSPLMKETGFGLANSATGMSYVAMYAHDMGNADVDWTTVAWPAGGAFPVELMHSDLAWSVTLNREKFDLDHSDIRVILSETALGLRFEFDITDGEGDGFCSFSDAGYGAGPCVIFRPDFSGTDFTDYRQNQRWMVRVDGLRTPSGEEQSLEYEVDMTSLFAQDAANVEISEIEMTLKAGEQAALTAQVIPDYADDLSVTWSSSDEAVATVADGVVQAVGEGTCEIIASSANGKTDRCVLTVEP